MPRKAIYQRGDIMCYEEELILKGNLTVDEFNYCLARDSEDWGQYEPDQLRHGWRRCTPARNRDEDYRFLLDHAEPHSRGAFEATWVVL